MKYFTMAEFTNSATANRLKLDNTPTSEHRANLEMFVAQLLDPLRSAWATKCANDKLGSNAINVTSGYRGFRLNAAVGGSKTSAHCVGYAADLVPANGRLAEFKTFCRDWLKGKPFDQMISEDENAAGVPRWIHIGYKNQQGGQRRQLMSMVVGKYKPMTV